MAARGLKTKIAFNVALLLLLSALITDILVVMVFQNVMIRDAVSDIEISTKNTGSIFFDSLGDNSKSTTSDFNPGHNLPSKLWKNASFVIWDSKGQPLFQHQDSNHQVPIADEKIRQALSRSRPSVEEVGIIWAVFWWHSEAVFVYVPLYRDDRLMGVAGARVPLAPVYEKLRNYNKPIFLYIILNTAILTFVGLYRIFRLYLRPIDRIVRQAEDFQDDGDLFFAFRHEDNELNRLSISLNQMLTRISSDKQKLRETVDSLERANRELQHAQREIIRAEKLASVGRLAAGIAHEIGNPIGIVLGYLDMLKDDDLDADEKADFLIRTEKEVQRINTVIRQLLDLARPQATGSQQVSLHEVLQDIVEVMRRQPILKEIQLELDLQADRDEIEGNQDQLRQVFLNLLLNAADAIRSQTLPVDGMIKVETRIAKGDGHGMDPCLKIRFEDNGVGIDPEHLQNIFDPFYTTKEPGMGTGLGLSVSYMIIEAFGGNMVADSSTGHGAVFTIHLPLQKPEGARACVAAGLAADSSQNT